jgi:hypothetical protein
MQTQTDDTFVNRIAPLTASMAKTRNNSIFWSISEKRARTLRVLGRVPEINAPRDFGREVVTFERKPYNSCTATNGHLSQKGRFGRGAMAGPFG